MDKSKYFSIFQSLDKGELNKQAMPNDKILWCDGLNTFIRNFVANPTVNENGVHIGGVAGFMKSLGYAIRNTNATRVIICFDGKGGSARRRKLFPEYKAGRKVGGDKRMTRINSFNGVEDEKISMSQQLQRLVMYLETLPVSVVSVENIEADDAIAYGVTHLFPESEHVIMSTDRDFLQLIDEKVSVWSPTKKKYYNQESFREEYIVHSHNYLIYKVLIGDEGDGIPGIRGCGLKTLHKRIPILFEEQKVSLEDIIQYCEANKTSSKLVELIANSRELLELNYKLIQLKDVNISDSSKRAVENHIGRKIDGLVKYRFQVLMLEDLLNVAIKNPDFWLKDTFGKLDSFIKILNKDKNE